MHSTYLLLRETDGGFYTGSTYNLRKRLGGARGGPSAFDSLPTCLALDLLRGLREPDRRLPARAISQDGPRWALPEAASCFLALGDSSQ